MTWKEWHFGEHTWLKSHPPPHPYTQRRARTTHTMSLHSKTFQIWIPLSISWSFLMRSYELPVYSPIIQTTDLGRRGKHAHITRLPWSFSSICWQSNSTTASRRSPNIHRWAHRGKLERQQSASLTLWNSLVQFGPQWLLFFNFKAFPSPTRTQAVQRWHAGS